MLRSPDHLIGKMGCEGEHRQNDEHERKQQQERGRRPAPKPSADQRLTY